MQRSISITLLLALFVQSVAVLALMGWVRAVATSEAKRELRLNAHTSEYRWFVIDGNNRTADGHMIAWMDDKEFRVDDVMYDVLTRHDSAGVTIVKAFPDSKETWARLHLAPKVQKDVHQRTHTGLLGMHLSLLLAFTGEQPRTVALYDQHLVAELPHAPMINTLRGFDSRPEIPPEEV